MQTSFIMFYQFRDYSASRWYIEKISGVYLLDQVMLAQQCEIFRKEDVPRLCCGVLVMLVFHRSIWCLLWALCRWFDSCNWSASFAHGFNRDVESRHFSRISCGCCGKKSCPCISWWMASRKTGCSWIWWSLAAGPSWFFYVLFTKSATYGLMNVSWISGRWNVNRIQDQRKMALRW